jgi:hypothetical protein
MAGSVLHTGYIRTRITGSGNLDLRLIGLYEDILTDVPAPPTQTLTPIAMATATPRLVQNLANFNQQYAQLEFSVDVIDEYFKINSITFYVKPIWSGFPG